MGAIVEEIDEEDDHGKPRKIVQRSEIAVANIFFKLMHQCPDGNILINKEEEQIAVLLNTKLQHAFESCKFTDESCTLLPFYDSVIPD